MSKVQTRVQAEDFVAATVVGDHLDGRRPTTGQWRFAETATGPNDGDGKTCGCQQSERDRQTAQDTDQGRATGNR